MSALLLLLLFAVIAPERADAGSGHVPTGLSGTTADPLQALQPTDASLSFGHYHAEMPCDMSAVFCTMSVAIADDILMHVSASADRWLGIMPHAREEGVDPLNEPPPPRI